MKKLSVLQACFVFFFLLLGKSPVCAETEKEDDNEVIYVDMEENIPQIIEAEDIYALPNKKYYEGEYRYFHRPDAEEIEHAWSEEKLNAAVKRLDMVDADGYAFESYYGAILVHDPKKTFGSEYFWFGGGGIEDTTEANTGTYLFAELEAEGNPGTGFMANVSAQQGMVYNLMDCSPQDYYKKLGRGNLTIDFSFYEPFCQTVKLLSVYKNGETKDWGEFVEYLRADEYKIYSPDDWESSHYSVLTVIFEDAYTGICACVPVPRKYLSEREFSITYSLPTSQYYVYLCHTTIPHGEDFGNSTYSYTAATRGSETSIVTLGEGMFFFQSTTVTREQMPSEKETEEYIDFLTNNYISNRHKPLNEEEEKKLDELCESIRREKKLFTKLVTDNFLVEVHADEQSNKHVVFHEEERDDIFYYHSSRPNELKSYGMRDLAEDTQKENPDVCVRMVYGVHADKVTPYQSDFALYTLCKNYGKNVPDGYYQSYSKHFAENYPDMVPDDVKSASSIYSGLLLQEWSYNYTFYFTSLFSIYERSMLTYVFTHTQNKDRILVCEGEYTSKTDELKEERGQTFLITYAFPIDEETLTCGKLLYDTSLYVPRYCRDGDNFKYIAGIMQSITVDWLTRPGGYRLKVRVDIENGRSLQSYFPEDMLERMKRMWALTKGPTWNYLKVEEPTEEPVFPKKEYTYQFPIQRPPVCEESTSIPNPDETQPETEEPSSNDSKPTQAQTEQEEKPTKQQQVTLEVSDENSETKIDAGNTILIIVAGTAAIIVLVGVVFLAIYGKKKKKNS